MQSFDERDSSSSKNSMYRSIVARTGSSEWRGAARSKIETAILDGKSSSMESDKAEPVLHNYHDEIALEDVKMEDTQQPRAEETGRQVRRYSEASASEDAINIYQANNIEEEEEADEEEAGSEDEKKQDYLNEDDLTAATEVEEEAEIPVIYRNWEPMDDVELNDPNVNHVGEVKMDPNAFEKARARSLAENLERQRRRDRCFTFAACMTVMALACLPLFITLGVVHSDNDSRNTGVVIVISPTPSGSGSTGTLLPLEDPVISNGAETVVVKFRDNMIVPEGYSVTPTVYDGPDCGTSKAEGGAHDITGQAQYGVEAGLYKTGDLDHRNHEASRMGLFLEWETDKVEQSPLYNEWGTANPYSTMDLCVGLAIADTKGQRVHYEETYILTTWMGSVLEKIRTVSITPDIN